MNMAIATHKRYRRLKAGAQPEILFLVLLVSGALLVRVSVMFLLQTYRFPTERSMGYEMGWIAQNLADGEGFKVGDYRAWMAPLFPFIMSLVFRLFGSYSLSSAIATLVLQSLVSSLTVIPLYFIGKRLFDREAGLIAALLWVIHPTSFYYAVKFVWSSSLTSLGLAVTVLLFLQLSDRHARRRIAALCGLVIGLTALSDPVILTFIPCATVWLLWRSKSNRKTVIGHVSVIGITATMVIVPWIIRNYRIFHQIVPIKSTFGVNLWQGNHSADIDQGKAGVGFWTEVQETYSEEEMAYLSSLNEVERDRVLRDYAVEFIVANPDTFVKNTLHRIYLFWRVTVRSPGTVSDKALLELIPFTCLGIIMSWRLRDTVLLLLAFISIPTNYYLTHADFNRFRFPIEGLMLVFASVAIGRALKFASLHGVKRNESARRIESC